MCVWHRRAQRPLQGGALAISSSNTSPCSLATKADLFSKHDQQIGKDEGGVRSHFECKKWIEIGFLATNLDRYPSNSSTKKPLIQLSSIHPFFTFALSSPKGPKLESSPEMSKSLPWNFEVVTSADLPACFLASLLIRSQVWPMWKGSLGRFGEMAKWVHNNSVLEFPTHYGSSTTRSGFVSFSVFFSMAWWMTPTWHCQVGLVLNPPVKKTGRLWAFHSGYVKSNVQDCTVGRW